MSVKITGKVTRLYIMPVGAEPLGQDGGQLFYGTPEGLGSTSDLSKFVTGPVTLGATDDSDTPSNPELGS